MSSTKKGDGILSALSKIRNQRAGITNAIDDYEVRDENEEIYEVVTEEEYQKRNLKRKLDDFIEGAGCTDDELDEYDEDDEESFEGVSRKPAPSREKSSKSIQQHFVEMAARESMAYKPPKPSELDVSVIEKYSKFEEDLDNELVSTNASASVGTSSNPVLLNSSPFTLPTLTPHLYAGTQFIPNVPPKTIDELKLTSTQHSTPINSQPLDETNTTIRDAADDIEESVSTALVEEIDPTLIDTFGEVDMSHDSLEVDESPANLTERSAILEDRSDDIPFYILDLCEGAGGLLHLFGRVRNGTDTESCLVTVTNMMRHVFFKANMDLMFTETGEHLTVPCDGVVMKDHPLYERHLMKNFYTEMEAIRKQYGIKKIKYKLVKRKLLTYGPTSEATYFKVCYPYSVPTLRKEHHKGTFYTDTYGSSAPITELFIIKRRIKGPSWLRLNGAVTSKECLSNCKVELEVDNHKSVALWFAKESEELPVPKLCIASISVKTFFVTPSQPEVLEISMMYDKHCSIDDMNIREMRMSNQYVGIRKVPSLHWPKELLHFISKRPYFRVFEQERGLLANFMKFLETVDPDVVVSHDTYQLVLETLVKRCNALNIPLRISFSRLKLLKKTTTPFCAGRLYCDTRVLTKELYLGKGNYDLSTCTSELVSGTPVKDSAFYTRNAFTMSDVKNCFGDSPDALKNLLFLVQANSKYAIDSFNLLLKIQGLPLTKELTNIAGNTWSRSLQCARSERNDFLLMHEFHRSKYILDHIFEKQHFKDQATPQEYEDEESAVRKGSQKRVSYEGGLVFEPISGLYDNFVLLLDFNSLYPSIIQEFNVCFTTAIIMDPNELTVEIDNSTVGMLPQILKRLVELRTSVKGALRTEKSASRKIQLGVRQLALKLAANSLYGCLGSPYSRFHAKHLAAYVTHQGRTVLQSTKEKVERTFGLQVIYGDTDSVMINTNIRDDGVQDNFNAANNIAQNIIALVNKGHKKLEIGIDAIFNRLLLLKKKKYAALKVIDYEEKKFEREIKGLDFIRRDWSLLTKEIGNRLLAIILKSDYGSGIDSIVEQIHEVLQDLNRKIKEGTIPMRSWLITRQLTKNPKDYADVQNLPHVSVALRLNERGVGNFTAGHEVSFIICSKESVQENAKDVNRGLSARAFSLGEVEELNLQPDVSYYKTQQLLPPILRLCGLIEGTDPQKLAKCLEVDSYVNTNVLGASSGYDFSEQESRALALIKRTEENYRDVELFTKLLCHFCNGHVLPSFFLKYLKCNHCGKWMPLHLLRNWVDRALYEVALQSCFCIRICNICHTTTLNVVLGAHDQCPQPTCQSSDAMEVVLSESRIYVSYEDERGVCSLLTDAFSSHTVRQCEITATPQLSNAVCVCNLQYIFQLYYDYMVYMLEGPLRDPGAEQEKDLEEALVNVTIDYDGKMIPLQNSEPYKRVRTFDEVVQDVIEQHTLKATSGLRVCGKHIIGIMESLPFLQYYTIDYVNERRLLCQRVKTLQQKNSYSIVKLSDLFSVFTIKKNH